MLSEGLTLADRFQVLRQLDPSTYVVQPVDEPSCELLLRAIAPLDERHFPVAEELRRALGVEHPHVATVHAVGALDDERMFFVQELLTDAQHLHVWAADASIADRIEVCKQALRALGAYHAQGLVLGGQRRIQLLVSPGPHLAVTDPGGLSEEFARSDLPVSSAATLAPERRLGVRVDRRANLYEFGALFYQAFAGGAPELSEAVWPHLAEAAAGDLPPEIAAWVMTLLAPRPVNRPASAEEALARLERILDPSAPLPEPAGTAGDGLIGRDSELASLLVWATALRGKHGSSRAPHVTRGDPSLLVLRGPPGIGKRRLVDEFLTQLAADGVRILRGDCAQQGQGLAGPLGPLLRRVLEDPTSGFDADAAGNATRWFVRELLGRAVGRGSVHRPPLLADPQREAERTLLALGEPLLQAAVASPLLLVLDNFDQATPLARALTEAIARRAWVARRWSGSRRALDPAGQREPTLLILGTSGDRGTLPRGRFVRPLDLSPLGEEALRQLAGDDEPDASHLAAGIPGSVVDPGALQAIEDVAERTVAETLAVLGRPGEFSLMAAVIGLGEDELRRALGELVLRGAVVCCAGQRYLLREDIAVRWRSELEPDALAARARRLCMVLGERHPPVPRSAQLLERVGFALVGPPPGAHAEVVRALGPSAIAHLEAISAYRQAAELCGRLADVQPDAEAQWRTHQARALLRAGQWRDALKAVDLACARGETSAELQLLAAGALQALAEGEQALERLERAGQLAADDPLTAARACLAGARIHAEAGDTTRTTAECERGLELVRSAGHVKDVAALRVRLLLAQVHAALESDEPGEAEQLVRAASALGSRVTAEALSSDVFLASARVSLASRDPGRASAAAARARESASAAGDLRGVAQAAIVFARAAWKVGHAAEAREALLGGVRVAEELGDPRALAESLDALGRLCHAAGALREGAQTLRRSLLAWVDLRERERAASTSCQLGSLLLDLGEGQAARTHLEEALEVQREVGDRKGELESLCALTELSLREGRYAQSQALAVRGRELAEEVGSASARSQALTVEAAVLRTLGDLPSAERLAQRGLRFAARCRDTGLELQARLRLGEILARRNEFDSARRNLMRVRRGAQAMGDRGAERAALLELAAIELAQGRGGHARALLDSRPVPRPGRMQPWLGKGPEGVGVLRARERLLRCRIELARENGSLHSAVRCAEEALEEAKQATLRDLEWRARYALAATYELRREHERALGLVVEAQETVEELQAAVPRQLTKDYLAVDPVRAAALQGDSPVAVLRVQMGNVSEEGLQELRAMLSLRMPTIEPGRKRPTIVEGSSAANRPLPVGTSAEEFARFVSLCRDLIDETHVERVFARLVRVAVELTEAERGFLAVFGDDADTFTAHATHGCSDLARPRERFARSCAFRAAELGQLVLSADVKVPAAVRERARLLGIGLRSVVAAPIALPNGQRGVLFIDHAFQPERFAARQVELIEALAALGGLALGRSALEQALHERRGLDPGALQRRYLEAQGTGAPASLPESLRFLPGEWTLVGASPGIGAAHEAFEHAVATRSTLVIAGPPGVGKGSLARLAASRVQRDGAPCVPVVVDLREVDPLGEALIGGLQPKTDQPCAARRASGGVLILERLDHATPALQAKLVDALSERKLRDGSPLDAWVICTAAHPDAAVQVGALRADLLALAGATRLDLPALEARPEDTALLVEAFVASWGDAAPPLSDAFVTELAQRPWPQNARQVYGVLRDLALRPGSEPPQPSDLPRLHGETLTGMLESHALNWIRGAVARAGGDLEAARVRLGLSEEELASWLAKDPS